MGSQAHIADPLWWAVLAILNKDYILLGKCARLFRTLFGIEIARATGVRSMLRTPDAPSRPTAGIRGSPAIAPDETGCCIASSGAWLHAFAIPQPNCYEFDPTRSADPLAELIGCDWPEALVHDGWSAYDQFGKATHQQCLAHRLRCCDELLETARGGAVRFPQSVKQNLWRALGIRARHAAGELADYGRGVLRGKLSARWEQLVATGQGTHRQ